MICPNCNGLREMFGFFPVYADHVPQKDRKISIKLPCDLCDATGVIDDDYHKRLAIGESLREKRLDKELTFRDFCKKFNLSVYEVSAFERGKKLNNEITEKIKQIYERL